MRLPEYLVATWILALSACPPARPPVPPPIDPTTYTQDCIAIYQQELGRAPDPGGLTNCTQIIVQAKRAGEAIPQEAFRAFVRASEEWKVRQEAQKIVVLPRQRARGQFIEHEDGTWHTVIETSDFALYDKWLNGVDLEPILAQREALGFNSVRVFGISLNAFPGYALTLTPAKHGERYYTELAPFFQALAQHHLYADWVAFASNFEMPVPADQLAHWDRLVNALRPIPNVILSAVNEDSAHGNQKLLTLFTLPRPQGVFSSHGSNGGSPNGANGLPPPMPAWDWLELHTNDTFERQRKVGHGCSGAELQAPALPCISTENTRADDRLTRTTEAFDSAAGAALLAAGATFHSLAGRISGLFEGQQLELAKAWVAGAKSVPLSCQGLPYQHGPAEIAEESSGGYLRVYQRGADPACRVRIRR